MASRENDNLAPPLIGGGVSRCAGKRRKLSCFWSQEHGAGACPGKAIFQLVLDYAKRTRGESSEMAMDTLTNIACALR